jgi:hypothetical protein
MERNNKDQGRIDDMKIKTNNTKDQQSSVEFLKK